MTILKSRGDDQKMVTGGDNPMYADIQTVKTETFTMDYARFGNGEKKLVILPGLSVQSVLASAEMVAAVFRPFTEYFTVYLFDRRNELPASYTISKMARDTVEALQILGLEDVYIYGASQGGMIAMSIAAEYPGLIHKLVLVSTTACVTQERAQTIRKWVDLARDGKAEDLYLAFGEAIYPTDVFSDVREAFIEMSKTVTADELNRFVILADTARNFDVMDALEKIGCPALVVGSRDDKVFGEEASSQIADAIPGSELYMYDGYGHAVYDTAPDFPARMLDFFMKE